MTLSDMIQAKQGNRRLSLETGWPSFIEVRKSSREKTWLLVWWDCIKVWKERFCSL